jgi:predicted amidohydrolase
MPPETVIEMGTIHGAKAALWYDEIGSLEKGKKADIAIFETRKPEWRPVLNPIANFIMPAGVVPIPCCATGRCSWKMAKFSRSTNRGRSGKHKPAANV